MHTQINNITAQLGNLRVELALISLSDYKAITTKAQKMDGIVFQKCVLVGSIISNCYFESLTQLKY